LQYIATSIAAKDAIRTLVDNAVHAAAKTVQLGPFPPQPPSASPTDFDFGLDDEALAILAAKFEAAMEEISSKGKGEPVTLLIFPATDTNDLVKTMNGKVAALVVKDVGPDQPGIIAALTHLWAKNTPCPKSGQMSNPPASSLHCVSYTDDSLPDGLIPTYSLGHTHGHRFTPFFGYSDAAAEHRINVLIDELFPKGSKGDHGPIMQRAFVTAAVQSWLNDKACPITLTCPTGLAAIPRRKGQYATSCSIDAHNINKIVRENTPLTASSINLK
jgi:hypothetical protein